MYFPVGWSKLIDTTFVDNWTIRQISCDRVKILLAAVADNFLGLWFTKPMAPIVFHKRSQKSLDENGSNSLMVWKPDSTKIAIATTTGCILLYSVEIIETQKGVFNHIDSPSANLRRDSAVLFIKEPIPSLSLKQISVVKLFVPVTSIACVSVSQIMVATKSEKIIRIRWDGQEERDYTVDLKRTPFSINQQVNYAVPITEPNIYVESIEYSPLVGGFAITFNDGRAGFLTSSNLKFDPNQVQGVWAPNLDDATCCSINHKFRLLAFGRKNSQAAVYTIEETMGGLELSHKLILSTKDFPGSPGPVNELKWTPDGCAVAMSWKKGGISIWSTFGTLLMCSLGWDYGVHSDLLKKNPLNVLGMDWSTEGYQLFLLRNDVPPAPSDSESSSTEDQETQRPNLNSILQLDFVKSALTVNPCMASHCHMVLQGDDKLYINQGNSLEKIYFNAKFFASGNQPSEFNSNRDENFEIEKSLNFTSMLAENKHWIVIQLPVLYMATNWPIRYSAIDERGVNLAVAGRTGIAHYSLMSQKWTLFGNETQEKDFIVTGGLLWWKNFIIMGCFSLLETNDEIRIYPKDCKLDNSYKKTVKCNAPVMLINLFKDRLIVFTADGIVLTFRLFKNSNLSINVELLYEIDIRSVCTHPACIVSLTMTNVKNEIATKSMSFGHPQDTLILNASGRILMIQMDFKTSADIPVMSTCLASCVECVWLSNSERSHMKDSLWLYCGVHGMRVWLPVQPCDDDIQRPYRHTFMSKRIMLSFYLKLYPLAILFEDVIVLGVENDTVLYTNDWTLHFSIPFCMLEKKSQVYLHQILRQLIRRNLGYNAWEIARGCTNLPYFPHSLELLLHEVLEDEATSKEPIPDALLPSVLEFIQEFPVYLQTIVQCARKTEIALWPYLFATAGKPKELFQQCLSQKQLETAASYLIILQNLEPSQVSRQYATLLLDTALENKKWELAKELVRFLKAIDPNDVDSPRSSCIINTKFGVAQQLQSLNPDAEDLSLILGTITRGRSFSTTTNPKSQPSSFGMMGGKEKQSQGSTDTQKRKKSVPNPSKEKATSSAEDFFIEVILQRHARRLLQQKKLKDLGYMSAALDFHLVGWLANENDRAARIEDFVMVLNQLHEDLEWPKPCYEFNSNDEKPLPDPTYFFSDPTANHIKLAMDSGYGSLPAHSSLSLANNEYEFMKSRTFPINEFRSLRDKLNNSTHELNNKVPTTLTCIAEESTARTRVTDVSSINSEEVSAFSLDIYGEREAAESKKEKKKPPKLEVKIRYLLHIFTEANCLEYSLVLSILLLDSASVDRITNAAIRSGSLSACRQIRNALKDITRWSFNECFGYREFMMKLQPQINILDKFVIQQESIPDFQSNQDPSHQQNGVRTPEDRKKEKSQSANPKRNSVESINNTDERAASFRIRRLFSEPTLSHTSAIVNHVAQEDEYLNTESSTEEKVCILM